MQLNVLPKVKHHVTRHAHVVHHAGHVAEISQVASVIWDSKVLIAASGVALIVCILCIILIDEA